MAFIERKILSYNAFFTFFFGVSFENSSASFCLEIKIISIETNVKTKYWIRQIIRWLLAIKNIWVTKKKKGGRERLLNEMSAESVYNIHACINRGFEKNTFNLWSYIHCVLYIHVPWGYYHLYGIFEFKCNRFMWTDSFLRLLEALMEVNYK